MSPCLHGICPKCVVLQTPTCQQASSTYLLPRLDRVHSLHSNTSALSSPAFFLVIDARTIFPIPHFTGEPTDTWKLPFSLYLLITCSFLLSVTKNFTSSFTSQPSRQAPPHPSSFLLSFLNPRPLALSESPLTFPLSSSTLSLPSLCWVLFISRIAHQTLLYPRMISHTSSDEKPQCLGHPSASTTHPFSA